MDMLSLWGDDFVAEDSPKKIKQIKQKIEKPKLAVTPEKALKSKTVSIEDKLAIIRENVMHTLGVYVNNTVVIKTKEQLHDYITASISNGIIAVDTETNNSLDPITCKLMGPCIYTPGQKNAYIPINHVDLKTNERLDWQLTEEDFASEMRRILLVNDIITLGKDFETSEKWKPDFHGQSFAQWYAEHIAPIVQKLPKKPVKFIFHNGKFDYQVIKCTCGVALPVDWDTMICAYILNENEHVSLKEQYIHKIDPSIEKYDIEKLFSGVQYAVVDPDLFALYAATDAYMTHRLYEWQLKQMALSENKSLETIYNKIELPIVTITAEMELHGVYIDKPYAERLSNYYHDNYKKLEEKLYAELETLRDKIEAWRKTPEANVKPITEGKNVWEIDGVTYSFISGSGGPGDMPYWVEKSTGRQLSSSEASALGLIDHAGSCVGKSKSEQLTDPVNLSSPIQLAILLYDVLGVREGIAQKKDKKNPNKPLRGTGEEIIKAIADEYDIPLCKLILKNREYLKLINTYIDSIPQCVNEADGRIHAHFHQYGAATGRFSSSDPNLQNIPSHNHTIRSLFRSAPGYVLIGSDYSAQEPRMLAMLSSEPKMKQAYKDGKDLYAVIAQMAFHNNYEDNLEHDANGNLYPEGKKRRSDAKKILLGLMYGRSAHSIAEQIGGTDQEAQAIINSFYEGFPAVKVWMDKTYEGVRKHGYVEDFWGRRRRLPDYNLPPYEVYDKESKSDLGFNPLLGCKGIVTRKKNPLIEKYEGMLKEAKNNTQKEKIKKEATQNGITILDNGGYIAQAERQCVNARVQGCLSYDTLILTKNGPEKIGDLSNKCVTVWDGKDWTDAQVLPSGKKKKCILTTNSGIRIVCSPDHKFLTVNSRGTKKFKKLSELKKQDEICTMNNKRIFDGKPTANISNIEITDEEIDMFDVCNTERGYFVANGLVTHNSSASLTKLAMIKIYNDPKMKEWDAHLIIGVHDELLMECKEEFAQEVADQLSYDMISAASDNGVDIPMKCDAEIFTWWYQDQIIGDIQDEVDALLAKESISKEDAISRVLGENYTFLTQDQIETFKKEIK